MAILSLEVYIPFSDTANSDYSDAVWLIYLFHDAVKYQ